MQMGGEGLEPSRLAAQGPKPCVYAISPPAHYILGLASGKKLLAGGETIVNRFSRCGFCRTRNATLARVSPTRPNMDIARP